MATKLCKWGNSLGMRLPKFIVERTGLVAGDYLYIRLTDAGEIVIRPVKAKDVHAAYKLAEAPEQQRAVSVPTQW